MAADLPIGDRIRHYRGGRPQDAVAGLVGISPDCLSQIERGLKVPSLPILYALAQELSVPAARGRVGMTRPGRSTADDRTGQGTRRAHEDGQSAGRSAGGNQR
ncbi:helix-turn-helix domain-containing protein [Streptomyces shenzhenensis]